jgi:hypothetical protein
MGNLLRKKAKVWPCTERNEETRKEEKKVRTESNQNSIDIAARDSEKQQRAAEDERRKRVKKEVSDLEHIKGHQRA